MVWKKKIEEFLKSGEAFIPVYENSVGTSVKLFFKDGSTEILNISCNSFLGKLLNYFGTSIATNRRRYGNLIGRKQQVPIALSYGVILVPFSAREPIGRQARTGWVLAKEIHSFIKKSPSKTIIQLSAHQVPVFHSERFCFEQLKNARCIELCFGEIHEPHRKSWIFSAG